MATPTADPAPSGDPVRAAAEAFRASQPPAPATAPPPRVSLEERARANAAAATPEAQRELPLWAGNDLPDGGGWTARDGILYDSYGAPSYRLKPPPNAPAPTAAAPQAGRPGPGDTGDLDDLWAAAPIEPVDLTEAFAPVAEAWADIVPPEMGSAQDLVAAVENDLQILEQAWRRTTPGPAPTPDRTTPQAAPAAVSAEPAQAQPAAAAVNTALQQADQHADALKELPEWQQLQTVRGAAAHLWQVIKEKAGPYFERLVDDVRVQGFWRAVSARTCQTIARGAQAGADRLRRGAKGRDLPAAEALLKVSDTALAYSSPRSDQPADATVAAAQQQNAAEIRQLRATLASNEPLPYATREEATAASREIAVAFQTWAESDMGKELCTSSHPRVVEFREAWQQLPPNDLPDGPGSAAGPFGAVAEHAQGIVERAQAQPGRFAQADLAALTVVADLAAHHGGRLAVTLPPDLTGPTASVQQVAPRPAVAVPAARSGGASRSA
ncbi:hypothetical protein [Streptomyces violascens]|uniref:hypothetical protein n=1 Tax=Streptomyces violascens TaxID=67381 RepID=UPI0036B09556